MRTTMLLLLATMLPLSAGASNRMLTTGFEVNALEHDPAFQTMRGHSGFLQEVEKAKRLEANARRLFDQELGSGFSCGTKP